MVPTDALEDELRRALRYLYDPPTLVQSPLISILRLQAEQNPAEALRNVLVKAIRSLQPDTPCAPQARGWRSYQILFYRYVQQLPQRDVSNQLSLSPRHLRREENSAFEALAVYLRAEFHLSRVECGEVLAPGQGIGVDPQTEAIEREMSWLSNTLASDMTEVTPVLREAVRLAQTLARNHGVRLDLEVADVPAAVPVPATVLKEVVLSLLGVAIRCVPGGGVSLAMDVEKPRVVLHLGAHPASRKASRPAEREGLDVARRLLEAFSCQLDVREQDSPLVAQVVLPTAAMYTVLAIEDNVDTLQLWQRYLEGTQLHLVGIADPQEALATTIDPRPEASQPDLILLDLMMPGVDGWQLLGHLRNHPRLCRVPIIVCTVLPHEELARSLGASAFLRKPFTRQAFLDVLLDQVEA